MAAHSHTPTNSENKKLTRSADVARPAGSVSEMGTERGCLDFLQRTASQKQFRCSTEQRKLASISSTKMNASTNQLLLLINAYQ